MSGINAYHENAIATQSRGRLIVLLYEGAVKFLRQAIVEIEKKDWAAKGIHINKACAILDELDACLDPDAGGQIATNLRGLYAFLRKHLGQANAQRDPQKIHEAIRILERVAEDAKAYEPKEIEPETPPDEPPVADSLDQVQGPEDEPNV